MAESTIPVDLLNPGQVFACLGILEATEVLLGGAAAAFDWRGGQETTFRIAATGEVPPMDRVVDFLEEAEIVTRAPSGSPSLGHWTPSWGCEPEVDAPGQPFPFPDPSRPATLPALLRDSEGNEISLEYWGDATKKRDNVKFWGGSGGKPGAAILRESVDLVRGKLRQHATNPFALSAPQTISFRFDWRRDYVSAQDGFSKNRHKTGPTAIVMVGFPLVEILAAIGVAHARPRGDKLEYRYGVLGHDDGVLLDPVFHRAALGAEKTPVPGTPFRRFVMHLDWPGQEDQARCITQVVEEGD